MLQNERERVASALKGKFRERGMGRHVALLSTWAYRSRVGHRLSADDWTDGFVERWAGILKCDGFESVFSVRPHASICPRCDDNPPCYVSCSFPGGYVHQCSGCHVEWLVYCRH